MIVTLSRFKQLTITLLLIYSKILIITNGTNKRKNVQDLM